MTNESVASTPSNIPEIGNGGPDFESFGIKSLTNISRLLCGALILFIPLAAIVALLTAYAVVDLQGYVSVVRQLSAESALVIPLITGLTLLYRLVYIVCIILTCWFLSRACRNLLIAAKESLTTKPHWAWLWFFIPFANFYKPYKSVAEIDRVTRRVAGISKQASPLLMAWWVCFILSVFLGATDIRLPIANLGQILMALDVVSGGVAIVAAILFIRIIRDLTAHQALIKPEGMAAVFD